MCVCVCVSSVQRSNSWRVKFSEIIVSIQVIERPTSSSPTGANTYNTFDCSVVKEIGVYYMFVLLFDTIVYFLFVLLFVLYYTVVYCFTFLNDYKAFLLAFGKTDCPAIFPTPKYKQRLR